MSKLIVKGRIIADGKQMVKTILKAITEKYERMQNYEKSV